MTDTLTIGSIGISVILSILLRMIYGTVEIQSKWKPWISTCLGVLLAIVVLIVNEDAFTAAVVVTYVVQGFMVGATAVGLYEMTKPRSAASANTTGSTLPPSGTGG